MSAGLANLERLDEPLVDCFGTSDPEMTAAAVGLLLTHLNWNSKQLLGAMVLDRLGADLLSRAQELVTFLSRHPKAIKKRTLKVRCSGMIMGAFQPPRVNWVIRLTSPHLP